MFQHILCATDLSKASLPATQVAASWASRVRCPLTLLHTYDPTPIGFGGIGGAATWAATSAPLKARAQKGLAEIALSPNVRCERRALQHTSAAVAICEEAEERGADLIVVATHGRSGIDRLMMGSVAEQVVRHAPCSVLVVRGVPRNTFPEHVFVCTDFSPPAQPAVALAADMAKGFESKVTLVHAFNERAWRDFTEDADETTMASIEGRLRDQLNVHHTEQLKPPVFTALAIGGRIPDAIVNEANRHDADLIVLGTHGRTGLSRLLMGSVAEQLARHAPCSVLVARSLPVAQ